jgi:hypothetical protein
LILIGLAQCYDLRFTRQPTTNVDAVSQQGAPRQSPPLNISNLL